MNKLLAALALCLPLSAYAVIDPVPVQTAVDESTGGTVSFSWTQPTAGNLIACGVSVSTVFSTDHTFTWPAGFTIHESNFTASKGGFNSEGAVGTKIATGSGETSLSWTPANNGQSAAVVCAEFSSTDLDTTLAASNINVTNSSTSNTSTGTGSASTTTTAGLAIYFLATERDAGWDSGLAVSNGTIRETQDSNARAGAYLASELLASSGAQSATWTTTDSGNESTGFIMAFDEAASSVPVDNIPQLVEDTFTNTNGTSIASHTPDTDIATNGWSIQQIWSGQAAGTATIQSNALQLADQTAAIIDVNTANMMFDVEYVANTTGGNVGVVLRYVDADNWWKCQFIPAADTIQLQRRVAGTTTTYGTDSFTFTNSQTYRLQGWAHSDDLGCAIDGVNFALVQGDVNHLLSTSGGVSADADTTNPTFDNLIVAQTFNTEAASGGFSLGQNSFFFGAMDMSIAYWLDPDDLPDQTNQDLQFYDGGDFYIDPETSYIGVTSWGIERYDSGTNDIITTVHDHTTLDTSPGTAPVFNDVDCALKTNSYTVNVDPGPVDFTGCLTTIGIPEPTLSVTVGAVPTGRVLVSGVESGIPTTTTGSPFSYTITATNATGSDTLAVTSTVSNPSDSPPELTSPIPDVAYNFGDDVSLDIGQYFTGEDTCSFIDLPTGLINVGCDVTGTATALLNEAPVVRVLATNSSAIEESEFTITVTGAAEEAPVGVIDRTGTDLLLDWSEAFTQGVSYTNSDWTLTCSGGAVTVTADSGDTTANWVLDLSRTIANGETCTLDYPGIDDRIQDSDNTNLPPFSDQEIIVFQDATPIGSICRSSIITSNRSSMLSTILASICENE